MTTANMVRTHLSENNSSTEEEISDALGISRARVNSSLQGLKSKGEVVMATMDGRTAHWALVAKEPADVVQRALSKRSALEMVWSA